MRRHSVIASLDGIVLARTERALRIEGNYYIPEGDVRVTLRSSVLTTLCVWKGVARYRHLELDDRTLPDAAWTYPLPSPLAWPIRRMIAFAPGSGVVVHRAKEYRP
ncbi:DUF427 domain-containing protein [Microbacterium sp. MYb62]|uniref:DUF427 domain-containing protein n=1 Tax=Microbacterium sp. MYb62 TaxID=1848690 RepID=UPI000CFB24C4|nr:DUF427 domain-containing protein [Microbacterium sp. MYb62]PRB13286.1 hypothetical protein CQ042_14000 [Microbacterium sp. MYb62]